MNDTTSFSTRNREAAAFFFYCRPDLLLAVTRAGGRACNFEFSDSAAIAKLNTDFHAGAGVDDAKALLESSKFVRDCAWYAQNDPTGVWMPGDGQ
jgi:hypothetical protein